MYCSVLCSVLQCVAVLQCVEGCNSGLRCVTVWNSMLHGVILCCLFKCVRWCVCIFGKSHICTPIHTRTHGHKHTHTHIHIQAPQQTHINSLCLSLIHNLFLSLSRSVSFLSLSFSTFLCLTHSKSHSVNQQRQ